MRSLRLLAGVFVAAAALSGSGAAVASPLAEDGDPQLNAPEVGSCHNLTLEQAAPATDTKRPVSCSKDHTLLTVKVKMLPTPVPWNDGKWLADHVYVPCLRAVKRASDAVRFSVGTSAYDLWTFIPSKYDRARGAAWVRCDLGLWGGRNRLEFLPGRSHLGAGTDREIQCLGGGRRLFYTNCARPHTFEPAGGWRLDAAPTGPQALRLAKRKCPVTVQTPRFAYTYPSAYEFKAGVRLLVCYRQGT